jgi:hypothetical protein
MALIGFATWKEVLEYARTGAPLHYQAPLDYVSARLYPCLARPFPLAYKVRPRTIRIWPCGSIGRGKQRTSDPFTANADHLPRFFRPMVSP